MADRGTSMLMMLIILAMFPAIFGALVKMGFTWKGFLGGGVAFCVLLSVSKPSSIQPTSFLIFRFMEKLTLPSCASCI